MCGSSSNFGADATARVRQSIVHRCRRDRWDAVIAGADGGRQGSVKLGQDPSVTPVSGPSWLNHLGVRYDETTLGRSGATYGPGPDQPAGAPPSIPLQVGRPVTLTGGDLYRLNCQACHRAEGKGTPPEIKSVFTAVQGSSLELVRRQLRNKGRQPTPVRQAPAIARADLVSRIKKAVSVCRIPTLQMRISRRSMPTSPPS